jgi:hypothetical protein
MTLMEEHKKYMTGQYCQSKRFMTDKEGNDKDEDLRKICRDL